MQIQKFLTTLALVTLGAITTMQATPKQQRDYIETLAASTPASSEFSESELVSGMSETPAKVHHLVNEFNNVSAMATNSDAWQKANRTTLSGTTNNSTLQATKQLEKEKNLLHGKIRKIQDAQKLIQTNVEQAFKILNDNKADRENRLTEAFTAIGASKVPMIQVERNRKQEAQSKPSEPAKAKKVKTGHRKPDEQYGAESFKKMKSSNKKEKSAKKEAKPKKEKKSKKNKKHDDQDVEVRYW